MAETKTAATTAAAEPNSNDPLRVYLRKMGTVPLLTREGEVELAKRIEEGTNTVRDSLFDSPVVVDELTLMQEKLSENRLRARELLNVEADDDTFDEETASNSLVEQIEKIKRTARRRAPLVKERIGASDDRSAKIDKSVKKLKTDLYKLLKALNFNKRAIDRMAQSLKNKAMQPFSEDLGISHEEYTELRGHAKVVRQGERRAQRGERNEVRQIGGRPQGRAEPARKCGGNAGSR